MAKTKVDYSKMQSEPSVGDLQKITELCNELKKLEASNADLEMKMQANNDRINKLELEIIPDLMLAAGATEVGMTDGSKVEVKDFVRGSIPTMTAIEKAEGPDKVVLMKRRTAAMKWLRAHAGEALIKNELTAEFGKGQDAVAKKLLENILKKGYKARIEESVNFQTLNSFMRDQMEAGVEVPTEPFALFVGKKAIIKPPKKEKA